MSEPCEGLSTSSMWGLGLCGALRVLGMEE